MIPFLQYSQKRELREKIFKAYINRGNHNDELDNKKTLAEIASLRVERAQLLGYKTHADYVLEENMAEDPGQGLRVPRTRVDARLWRGRRRKRPRCRR